MFGRLRKSAYLARQLWGQKRFPFRPLEDIRRAQSRRVRRMIEHAYNTVPYWRDTLDRLKLKPKDFRDADDLKKLPIMEPRQLQEDPNYFVSRRWDVEDYYPLRTGGSSGARRLVYWDVEGILANAAHAERERCMVFERIGRRFGYRETIIGSPLGTAPKLQRLAKTSALLPDRLQIKRQHLSMLDPVDVNLRQLNEFKPDVVQSYGSYLAMLFTYIADHNAPYHRPKAVSYSSDNLPESARKLLLEHFKIPLYSTYEAHEGLKIGFECDSHLGLHVNMDLYPVRIVDRDGRDLPPGQAGDALVSNLVNRATVLFNYRLGDLAMFLPEPCPCGRNLPLISFPLGRIDDWVELPSGQLAHPQSVRKIFVSCGDALWLYQLIQEEPTKFTVRLVVSPRADRVAIEHSVRDGIAELFGADARVDILWVDEIERNVAGKLRPIISLRHQRLARDGGGRLI